MIGYLMAWIIYLLASVFLLKVYRRSFVFWLPAPWRSVSVLLLAVMLLTPWPIDGDTWLPAPAIIATVFNLMEADGLGVFKSLFPLLLLSTLVCSVAWWKSRKAES
jgi:hypothetical protein